MSLNKFTNLETKPWMKINCSEVKSNKLTIVSQDGSSINMTPSTSGALNQVLSSNGDGTVKWNTPSGGGGLSNPIAETLYPINNAIDLGTAAAPFRKLYVSNATIDLINTSDTLKSGSMSILDGNIHITSNSLSSNVNLGNQAGVGAGINCTNIGNKSGNGAGTNCVNIGLQAGYQNCLNNAINIGNGASLNKSGENSIAIGTLTGASTFGGIQGANSIKIGKAAALNNSGNNCIILNATGDPLDTILDNRLIIKPIRTESTLSYNTLQYEATTGEITSSASINNKLKNIDEIKTDTTRTYFNKVLESDTGYKITGGLATQFLMADGTTTIASAAGNTSNIYLYDNSIDINPPPLAKEIRYNNLVQDNATLLYINHLTRELVDIDEFLAQISDLSIIYIQDQASSLNFIRYIVTAAPTIVLNQYITVPILKQSSGGTGATSFGNNHNIFMSIFSNTTLIDNRITSVENKTQNQMAVVGETTFTGKINGLQVTDLGLPLVNNTLIGSIPYTNLNAIANTAIGSGSLALSGGNNCTAIGVNSQKQNLTSGSCISVGNSSLESATESVHNVALGLDTMRNSNNDANYNTSVGNFSLSDCKSTNNTSIGYNSGSLVTTQTNSISIGHTASATASNQCVIGNSLLTEIKSAAMFNSDIGFKTKNGASNQVLLASGAVDYNMFKLARKNWDVIPLALANGNITTNSWDYYINEQVPYDMYITKIRVSFITNGSDTSRFAIFRGNDLTATLVAQTAVLLAGDIIQPYTTLDFILQPGLSNYFTKDEGIVIAYAVSGVSTKISSININSGNNSTGWYNTTDSSGGFLTNPKIKSGASVVAFCCRLIVADTIPLAPILVTPILTSAVSDPYFLITRSSEVGGYEAWHLFDGLNIIPTNWLSGYGTFSQVAPFAATNVNTFNTGAVVLNGAWVKISLSQQKRFNYFRVEQSDVGSFTYSIADFMLFGSNDNITFTLLNVTTNYVTTGVHGNWMPKISVANQQYQYIVFLVTRINGNSGQNGVLSLTGLDIGYD